MIASSPSRNGFVSRGRPKRVASNLTRVVNRRRAVLLAALMSGAAE